MAIDDDTIDIILDHLEKTSIRDRSKGADTLKALLNECPDDIPDAAIYEFLRVLVDFYEVENIKYQKLVSKVILNNESSLESKSLKSVELRTSEAAYLLRFFIEKLAPRFTGKHMLFILPLLLDIVSCTEITFNIKPSSRDSGSKLESRSTEPKRCLPFEVSTNFSFAIAKLVKMPSFHLKKTKKTWAKTMETGLLCINQLLDIKKPVSPDAHNWLTVLLELLKQDTLEVGHFHKDLVNTVYRYVSSIDRETNNALQIMKLVNKTLLRTHLMNLNCVKLIKPIIALISKLQYFKKKDLCLEISYFNHFISELLPAYSTRTPFNNNVIDWFPDLESLLQLFLSACYNKKFNFQPCFLPQEEYAQRIEWVQFLDFQYSPKRITGHEEDLGKWSLILSVTKLLNVYFIRLEEQSLQNPASMSLVSGSDLGIFSESVPDKKVKYSYELLTGCLKNSENIYQFIINTLDDTSIEESKILGLQICAFYTSMFKYDMDYANLIDNIILLMGNDNLFQWCCLSIITIVSTKNYKMSQDHFEKILKLVLPKFTDLQHFVVSCTVVNRIVAFQNIKIADKTLLYRLYDTIDVSIVNGPVGICYESLETWKSLYHLAPLYKSSTEETIIDKFYQWFSFKWSSCVNSCSRRTMFAVSDFILWLSKRAPSYPQISFCADSFNFNYYSDWMFLQNERHFLYKITLPKVKRAGVKLHVSFTGLPKIIVTKLFDKLNGTLNDMHQIKDVGQKIKVLGGCLHLITNLASIQSFASEISSLIDSVLMVCKYIKTDDYQHLMQVTRLLNSIDLTLLPYSVAIELEKCDIPGMYKHHQYERNSDEAAMSRLEDVRNNPESNYPPSFISDLETRSFYCEDFERVILATLGLSERIRSVSDSLELCLNFMMSFSTKYNLAGTKCLLACVQRLDMHACGDTIMRLLKGAAELLLTSDYNTSNQSIEILSQFLSKTTSVWLDTSNKDYMADGQTILAWIQKCFDKMAFDGCHATLSYATLTMQLLQNSKLIKLLQISKNEIFDQLLVCVSLLPLSYLSKNMEGLGHYMLSMNESSKNHFVSKLAQSLNVDEMDFPQKALYLFCITAFSSVSNSNLIKFINNITSLNNEPGFDTYVQQSLKVLATKFDYNDTLLLLEKCKYAVLEKWYIECVQGTDVDQVPPDIKCFGFQSIEDFVNRFSVEITALHFSHQIHSDNVLTLLLKVTSKTELELVRVAISLTLALAYSDCGRGDQAYKYVEKSVSNKFLMSSKISIAYTFLMFACIDDLPYQRAQINECFPKSALKDSVLFGNQAKFNSGIGIQIHTIKAIFFKHQVFKSLQPREINFLLLKLLSELKATVSDEEQVLIVRRIKLTTILFERCLGSESFVLYMATELSGLIEKDSTHDEVCFLLVGLLSLFKFEDLNVATFVSRILNCLLEFQELCVGIVNQPLLDVLGKLVENQNTKYDCWIRALVILNGQDHKENYNYYHGDLLDCSQPDADIHLSFLSRLFTHLPEPCSKNIRENLSGGFTKCLLLSNVAQPSFNFKLWITYSLQKYYQKHYDRELPVVNSAKPKLVVPSFGSLSAIIPLVQRNISHKTPSDIRFVSECVLGVYYSRNTDEVDYFKQRPETCSSNSFLAIDLNTFFMLNTKPASNESFQDFVSSSFRKRNISYRDWILSFWSGLVSDLVHIDFTLTLQALANIDLLFVENSLVHFLLFSIYANKNKDIYINMLNSLQLLLSCKDYNQKLQKMLDLVEIVRSCTYYEGDKETQYKLQKHLREVYQGISKVTLFEVSLHIKNFAFAYMLLDETYVTFDDFDGNKIDIQTLFTSFKDEDLVFCVPKPPSLRTTLELLNFSRSASAKKFMFNSSAVDVGFKDKTGEGFLDSLIKSSVQSGCSTISQLLLTKTQNEVDFDWYSGLDNWDLPSPEKFGTETQLMHDFIQRSKSEQLCESELFQSIIKKTDLAQFLTNDRFLDTISEVVNMESLLIFKSDKYASFSCYSENKDKYMINAIGWENYEFILKSRIKFLENRYILSIKDRETIGLSRVFELIKYNSFCRDFKSPQSALKSAMELDELISSELKDHPKISQLKNLSSIHSAQTIWLQGDTIMPVKMLTDLLATLKTNFVFNKSTTSLEPSNCYISSRIVEYASKSRQMSPMRIYHDFVMPYKSDLEALSSVSMKYKIYYVIGDFFYHHSKVLLSDPTVALKQVQVQKHNEELKQLQELYFKTKSETEKKDTSRYFKMVQDQSEQDSYFLEEYTKEKNLFVYSSLEYFAKAMKYSESTKNEILDKFCGLWFQISEDVDLNAHLLDIISEIETFKLLPWVNQMVSKLHDSPSNFQVTLTRTVKRIVYNFPCEGVYHLLNAKLYGNSKLDSFSHRIRAVDNIINSLNKKGNFKRDFFVPISEFVNGCILLASRNFDSKVKSFDLSSSSIGDFWMNTVADYKLPLPTVCIPVNSSEDGLLQKRSHVALVSPIVVISPSGISRPKIMEFILSTGEKHRVLVKGNDDLRQDAIMQQVFKQVNMIFSNHHLSKKKKLSIRTYEIVPMGNTAGIIEFIEKSASLRDILLPLHKTDLCSLSAAREIMKRVTDKTRKERVAAYTKLEKQIQPSFRKYFFHHYNDPDAWLSARYTYAKSLVTTSVVGHLLGIGDRHLQNIMINVETGELVHIDFGIAFDRGKSLSIPEMVPFRLTRDLVDALGISGIEGLFRKNFEYAYRLLREEQEKVMSVLNILKWDPLYSWSISPLKRARLESVQYSSDKSGGSRGSLIAGMSNDEGAEEENDKSIQALSTVQKKLTGLSVEATVQELIVESTSVENLATIFYGWSPFY